MWLPSPDNEGTVTTSQITSQRNLLMGACALDGLAVPARETQEETG